MRRRSMSVPVVLAAMLALVVATFATACGSVGEASSPPPTTAKPAEYKYTVAGDSISIGLGASLRKVVEDDGTVVKVIGEEGTGLAQPSKFDWPARIDKLAAEFPPDVLVFSVGSNDAQELRDKDGTILVPFASTGAGAMAWDAEYSKRLAQVFDAFKGPDGTSRTKIVWVGHVRTAEDRIGLVNRRIHKLATAVASTRPWVVVTDLAELLGTGEQKATRCLRPDGVHVTIECLDEAAKALEPKLPARTGG